MKILTQSTLLNFVNVIRTVSDNLLYFIGPFFILLAVVLISGCVFLYYTAILPYVTEGGAILYYLNLVLSMWLLSNIFFNYFTTVFTKPGSPPIPEGPLTDTENPKICKKCFAYKHERTHHCSVCRRCVYKLDHHCPWMHNCVGHRNHRGFFLFLLYLWLGCVYYILMSSFPFFKSMDLGTRRWNALHPYLPRGLLSFSFILAGAISISLTVMTFWNLYLILTSQTTLEFQINSLMARDMKHRGEIFVNYYDLGALRNLKYFFNVCEKYPWWTALLPISVPPYGDGITFPSIKSGAGIDI